MNPTEWMELATKVPFSILVAGWFMWRLNGKLERLVGAMAELASLFREHQIKTER